MAQADEVLTPADDQLATVFQRLAAWGADRRWVGPDPYEGLNVPLARIAPGKKGRQVVVQAYKRLPFTPPWPLSAPLRANSKALGIVVSAYSTPAGSGLPSVGMRSELIDQLASMRIEASRAWGYHFDLQTRHLFYEGSEPNAIATCFVAQGLLDTGEDAAAELALEARPFLRSLLRDGDAGSYFAYVGQGSRLVHNANVMVCGTLARLHELVPDEEVAGAAVTAAETTIRCQDGAGLWPYGEAAGLEWADNFHTAYILENLLHTDRVFGIGAEAFATGMEAWRDRFFDADAGARYEPDDPYPQEAHSFASAIDLCCAARGVSEEWLDFADRIAARAIELLWLDEAGRFAYRVSRLGRNDREFMRWTNVPMFRALARLLSERGD